MLDGGIVELEAGVCSTVVDDLKSRGHRVFRAPNGGGYQVSRSALVVFYSRSHTYM
jgi:hypothetical protein